MKFLRERTQTNKDQAVRLINPVVNLESIPESARTTGNEWIDLGLDTAIKFADKLHETKRKNEFAELQVRKAENFNKFEAEWAGKDKFSDENYTQYIQGLNKVLDDNQSMVDGTKYLNKDDVNTWINSSKMDRANRQYEAEGRKAEYDIKFNIDKTMVNYQGLMMNYANARSEKEADSYLKEGMELLQTLNPFINNGELLKMQFKALTDAQVQRTERQVSTIINSSMSVQDKRKALINFKDGLKTSEVYTQNAEELAKKGIIPKNVTEAFASASKEAIQNSLLQSGGYISRLESEIRDEEYRINREIENSRIRALDQYKQEKLKLNNALTDSDFLKAINLIEEEAYTMDDILTSPSLTVKYLGKTPAQIIDEGGYVPSMDRDTLNQLLEEKNKDLAGGIPRNLTVESVMNRVMQSDNIDIRKNMVRELFSRGVITQTEYGLYNQEKPDMINYLRKGEEKSGLNKVSLSNFSMTNQFANKLRALDNKSNLAIQILHGAIESGKFGVLLESGDKFDSVSLNRAYHSNKEFREFANETISAVDNININKYDKAQIDRVKMFDVFDSKKGKGIKNRLKTFETGVEPMVQLQSEDELLGWD